MSSRFVLLFFILAQSVLVSKQNINTKICGDIFTCANLEENINFWIKISSDYNSTGGVLHDRSSLKIYKQLSTVDNKEIRLEKQKIAEQKGVSVDTIRFQRGFRDRFVEGITNSIIFKHDIENILQHYGVNKELFFLTFTESGFNPFAVSKVGAKGVWQITKTCWRAYLPQELSFLRTDPIFSSFVSAQFISDNLKKFNNYYPLAITAYNYGEKALSRAIKKLRTKNIRIIAKVFDDENLGFAVQNFYASFLASRFVGRKLLRNNNIIKKKQFIYVVSPIKIKDYQGNINLSLNPVLVKQEYIPEYYPIRVYKGKELQVIQFIKSKISNQKFSLVNDSTVCKESTSNYKIKKGDNLLYLANKFKLKLAKLMKDNNIKKANKIYIGQKLKIKTKVCKTQSTNIKNKVADVLGKYTSVLNKTQKWSILYNLLINNEANIYFIYTADNKPNVVLYSKDSVNIYPRALLPSLTFKELSSVKNNELFSVYFYNKEQKRAIIYLAPWESIEKVSEFLKYDLYKEAHIPVWVKSLNYQAVPVKFNKINMKEFVNLREQYYQSLIDTYLKKYILTGKYLTVSNKEEAKEYPSYILYKYNPQLLFKDIEYLKQIYLPNLRVRGEVL